MPVLVNWYFGALLMSLRCSSKQVEGTLPISTMYDSSQLSHIVHHITIFTFRLGWSYPEDGHGFVDAFLQHRVFTLSSPPSLLLCRRFITICLLYWISHFIFFIIFDLFCPSLAFFRASPLRVAACLQCFLDVLFPFLYHTFLKLQITSRAEFWPHISVGWW